MLLQHFSAEPSGGLASLHLTDAGSVQQVVDLSSLPKELWALILRQLALNSQARCTQLCRALGHEASRISSATAGRLTAGVLETLGVDAPFALGDALEALTDLVTTAAEQFGTLGHVCGRLSVPWRWRDPPGRAFDQSDYPGSHEKPCVRMGRETRVLHNAVLRLHFARATRDALAHSEATFRRSQGTYMQDLAVTARVTDLEVPPPAKGYWTCLDVTTLRDRIARERLQPHLRALAQASEEYGPDSEAPADSVVARMRVRSVRLDMVVIEVEHYVYNQEHFYENL